jgi:hypothetical protein
MQEKGKRGPALEGRMGCAPRYKSVQSTPVQSKRNTSPTHPSISSSPAVCLYMPVGGMAWHVWRAIDGAHRTRGEGGCLCPLVLLLLGSDQIMKFRVVKRRIQLCRWPLAFPLSLVWSESAREGGGRSETDRQPKQLESVGPCTPKQPHGPPRQSPAAAGSLLERPGCWNRYQQQPQKRLTGS